MVLSSKGLSPQKNSAAFPSKLQASFDSAIAARISPKKWLLSADTEIVSRSQYLYNIYMMTGSGEVKIEDIQGQLCITLPLQSVGMAIFRLSVATVLIVSNIFDLSRRASTDGPWWTTVHCVLIVAMLYLAWETLCIRTIRISEQTLTITQRAVGLQCTRVYQIAKISRFGTRPDPNFNRVILVFVYRGFTRRIKWRLQNEEAQLLTQKIQKYAPQLACESQTS